MIKKVVWLNVLILCSILLLTLVMGRSVTVMLEQQPVPRGKCVIIDAGHGGPDGGATSISGTLESHLNLEISRRLRDMCNLFGINVIMIRDEDRSVHTEGESIAQRKISDLKNRVQTVNNYQNQILVSIHQNYFTNSKYYGAQVFYANTEHSAELAEIMQASLVENLYPNSNRKIKKATGIYLMEHIKCPGILIECGFLSNRDDTVKLEDKEYQKRLSSIIACTLSTAMNEKELS